MATLIKNDISLTKLCGKCKRELTLNSFNKRTREKDGLYKICKKCLSEQRKRQRLNNFDRYREINERSRQKHIHERLSYGRTYHKIWYKKNKEKVLKKGIEWRRSLSGRFSRYKSGAKVRNIDFGLTFGEFKFITEKQCVYCCQFSTGEKYCGIDRINSKIGYNVENCVPCCDVCNYMKQDYDFSFFINHIKKISEVHCK